MDPINEDASMTTQAPKPSNALSDAKKADAAKIKESLAKMRNKRKSEGGETPGANVSGGAGFETPMASTPGNNSTRKQLASWRQKNREKQAAAEASAGDDLRRSAGRQGPRSPLKSTTKSRSKGRTPGTDGGRRRTFSDVNDDGDYDNYYDEDEEADAEEDEEEEEEEYFPIMQIEPSQQTFPLSFAPKPRAEENEIQRVVLVPTPAVTFSDIKNGTNNCCRSTANGVCSCFECCGGGPNFVEQHLPDEVFHERDFLLTEDNYSLTRWLQAQKTPSPVIQRFADFIAAAAVSSVGNNHDHGNNNSSTHSPLVVAEHEQQNHGTMSRDANEYEESQEFDSLFDLKSDRVDGIYNGNPPTLAGILLESEQVPPSLAKMSAANFELSRATQRLLRDLKTSIAHTRLRTKWRKMLRGSGSGGSGIESGGNEPRGIAEQESPREREDVEDNENEDEDREEEGELREPRRNQEEREEEDAAKELDNDHEDYKLHKKKREIPAEFHLLRDLRHAPMLQILENPVVGGTTQPLIPKPNLLYGGQIGQWGFDGTPTDRLGPLPRGFSDRRGGQRAIFRLHLHQLIFTDHPLMSAEARQLVELKEIYAQYRSLFEQKILEFLTQRLFALTSQLAKLVEEAQHRSLDEDETAELRGIYRDLIETLPALNELNKAVDGLSAGVYQGWRELLAIRRKSGEVICTTADLCVRKVKSNLVAPSAAAAGAEAGGTASVGEREARSSGNSVASGVGKGVVDSGGGNLWSTLQRNLTNTPALLQQAQEILFHDDLHPSLFPSSDSAVLAARQQEQEVQESPRGSEFGGSQAVMRANEEQRARKASLERVIKVMGDAVGQLLRSNGLIPQYALRLTEDGKPLTPDNQLPVQEVKRRALLKSLRVKINVRVNGTVVTSSDYYPLRLQQSSSELSVDFNKFFEFRVLTQPNDVVLDLYTNTANSWSMDTYVSSIPIPFPGQSHSSSLGHPGRTMNAAGGGGAAGAGGGDEGSSGGGARHQHVTHSYAPSAGWYSFSSDTQMSRSLSKYFGNMDTADAAFLRRVAGSILCTTDYDSSTSDKHRRGDTVRHDDLALLPTVKQSVQAVTKRGGHTKVHDFTRENDFQSILPELEDIDTNDPSNDHLIYLKSKRDVGDSMDTFRLSGWDFGTVFTSDDGTPLNNYVRYKEPPRMKLLQLRCLKPYLFNSPIPLSETAIKNSEVYRAIFTNELHETMARVGGVPDDPDAEKLMTGKVSINTAKVSNFLQRVRSSQTAQSRKKQRKKFVTSSVVVEKDYFQVDKLEVVNLLERKRDLHPRPKNRNPVSVQIDKCELLVQVVGAKNIPLRIEQNDLMAITSGAAAMRRGGSGAGGAGGAAAVGGGGATAAGDGAGAAAAGASPQQRRRPGTGMSGDDPDAPVVSEHMLDERKIRERRRARTFVEVRFQENSISTAPMDGAAPMWRQSISLPFKAPQDDFSPASLEQVREELYFTLFDEVEEDDSERGGLLEGESPFRVEKRYLGSFSIPFETIYKEGRIEGVFRLDTPAINFGYDHSATKARANQRQQSAMFESQLTEQEQQQLQEAAENPLWKVLKGVMECVSQTNRPKEHPNEGLYSSGSYLSDYTQSEFSYYVTDDKATYVKVMITIDPLLTSTPDIPQEISLTNVIPDDRAIASYARRWLQNIQEIGSHTQDRMYKLFGTNSAGLNVFLCRFLTPQAPPEGYMSRRACIHLISNIPFMNDAQSFLGEFDLWCTSQQFWEIGAGDEEEHAVTLFNYLYFLSLKTRGGATVSLATANDNKNNSNNGGPNDLRKENVFLVMGKAVPEGETVYVMLRDTRRTADLGGNPWTPQNFLVINPWTGYIYSALDTNCPLRDVCILATPDNVWANVQIPSRPAEMNFDLANPACWRPFFGARFPMPSGGLNTVQTEIEYVETSPGYALEIEKSIFQSIRNNIRKWRSRRQRSATTFHPDACAVMHDMLPKMENWKRSGNPEAYESSATGGSGSARMSNTASGGPEGSIDQDAALMELQRLAHDRMTNILRTRKLKGFPMNMPFTDVEEVLTKIKTMCIHEAKHPEVQFVMAVRAFPLYNNILSLWIFLGFLEPKQ